MLSDDAMCWMRVAVCLPCIAVNQWQQQYSLHAIKQCHRMRRGEQSDRWEGNRNSENKAREKEERRKRKDCPRAKTITVDCPLRVLATKQHRINNQHSIAHVHTAYCACGSCLFTHSCPIRLVCIRLETGSIAFFFFSFSSRSSRSHSFVFSCR